MAVNEELDKRVRAALSSQSKVEERKMFRGVLYMVNGKVCVSTGDDELMVRIDPDLYEEALKKKGVRPMTMKGKPYKGYVYVKQETLKSKKDFDYWISLALEFNKKAKAPKKKPSR